MRLKYYGYGLAITTVAIGAVAAYAYADKIMEERAKLAIERAKQREAARQELFSKIIMMVTVGLGGAYTFYRLKKSISYYLSFK